MAARMAVFGEAKSFFTGKFLQYLAPLRNVIDPLGFVATQAFQFAKNPTAYVLGLEARVRSTIIGIEEFAGFVAGEYAFFKEAGFTFETFFIHYLSDPLVQAITWLARTQSLPPEFLGKLVGEAAFLIFLQVLIALAAIVTEGVAAALESAEAGELGVIGEQLLQANAKVLQVVERVQAVRSKIPATPAEIISTARKIAPSVRTRPAFKRAAARGMKLVGRVIGDLKQGASKVRGRYDDVTVRTKQALYWKQIARTVVRNVERAPSAIRIVESEQMRLRRIASELGEDLSILHFNQGRMTAYIDRNQINVVGNIYPRGGALDPLSRMSERAVLAHEFAHRRFDVKTGLSGTNLLNPNSLLDEYRTNVWAAMHYKSKLSPQERLDLLEAARYYVRQFESADRHVRSRAVRQRPSPLQIFEARYGPLLDALSRGENP